MAVVFSILCMSEVKRHVGLLFIPRRNWISDDDSVRCWTRQRRQCTWLASAVSHLRSEHAACYLQLTGCYTSMLVLWKLYKQEHLRVQASTQVNLVHIRSPYPDPHSRSRWCSVFNGDFLVHSYVCGKIFMKDLLSFFLLEIWAKLSKKNFSQCGRILQKNCWIGIRITYKM